MKLKKSAATNGMSIKDQVAYLKKELEPEDPMSKLARSDFQKFDKHLDTALDGRKDLGLTKGLIGEYDEKLHESSISSPPAPKKGLKKPQILALKTAESQVASSPSFSFHIRSVILLFFAGIVLVLCPFVFFKRRRTFVHDQLSSQLLSN